MHAVHAVIHTQETSHSMPRAFLFFYSMCHSKGTHIIYKKGTHPSTSRSKIILQRTICFIKRDTPKTVLLEDRGTGRRQSQVHCRM